MGLSGLTADVLSALLTPAVLISACASLLISTSSRLGRVVDDVRKLSDSAEKLESDPKDSLSDAQRQQRRALVLVQLPLMARRARLLQASLAALYSALTLFIATSVVLGLFTSFAVQNMWLPTALGLLGVVLLLWCSLCLIIESHLALRTTYREMRMVYHLVDHESPADLRDSA